MKNQTQLIKRRFVGNDTMIDKIKTLYVEKGMSAPKIAKEVRCSSLTVLNILRSQNVTIRRRGTYPQKIKTDIQINKIFDEYKNGKSLSAIAVKFGVNPNTIYYHMKKHNEEIRTNRKLSPADVEYIQKKCQTNPSKELVEALAEKFNITPNAVRYHVRKNRKSHIFGS